MLDQPELPGAPSETGTKVTEFVLTSSSQSWLYRACHFFSPQCFCSPALCDCPKGKHIPG